VSEQLLLVAYDWINGRLRDDATILGEVTGDDGVERIYSDSAPPDTAFPFILYGEQANEDLNGVGGERIDNSGLYLVRFIARADDWASLKPIAERIDMRLHLGRGAAVNGGEVAACWREREFKLVERPGGEVRHLGGFYRIMAQG
jgi:hypothetical protein